MDAIAVVEAETRILLRQMSLTICMSRWPTTTRRPPPVALPISASSPCRSQPTATARRAPTASPRRGRVGLPGRSYPGVTRIHAAQPFGHQSNVCPGQSAVPAYRRRADLRRYRGVCIEISPSTAERGLTRPADTRGAGRRVGAPSDERLPSPTHAAHPARMRYPAKTRADTAHSHRQRRRPEPPRGHRERSGDGGPLG